MRASTRPRTAIPLLLLLGSVAARGQDPAAAPPDAAPVERADELLSKATLAVYLLSGDTNVDANVRHKFGGVTAWVGGFLDPKGKSQGRVGAEYDFQQGILLAVPTVQAASNGFLAGSIYTEIGSKAYLIAGYSVTNLKPYVTITFDPNDSAQLGAGIHLSGYDRVFAYTIWDIRLGTRQQDTHILFRHRLNDVEGVTVDVLYKSGEIDDGTFVNAVGVGVYYDRPRWFVKAYYDPYVNFSDRAMLRVGGGVKF